MASRHGRRARRVLDYRRSERRTLRQGYVALLISPGGDLLAGGLSAQVIGTATGKISPGVFDTVAVMFAGFLDTIVSSAIAYYGAVATYRFGWDPDNFGVPLVTSLMDLDGTLCPILDIVLFVGRIHG